MKFTLIAVLNGISFGMILFLLTTGLSITLGLMGILNLTHGALFMVGAFIGWTVAVKLGMNYWLAVLLGGIVAGLIGLAIERGVLRFLYKQINEQVLATIGFVYILINICQWIWGGLVRMPFTSPAFSGSISFLGKKYPIFRFATIAIGIILLIGLWWLQDKNRIGIIVRAGMDDEKTITGLGINLNRINYLVFFFGAFLAGIAGVFGAALLGAQLDMGWDILLLALIVLVVGGVGSIQGAFVGAILIGLVDAFGRALFPNFAMFLMYLAMIIIIVARPSGLIPRGAKL